MRAPSGHRLIHVVGQPGSGKTVLSAALSARLGITRVDLADMGSDGPRAAWTRLAASLTRDCIVETTGASRWERGFWPPGTVTVMCTAPEDLRRQRVWERPEASREARWLLSVGRPIVAADHTWDSRTPIASRAFDALVERLRDLPRTTRVAAPVDDLGATERVGPWISTARSRGRER